VFVISFTAYFDEVFRSDDSGLTWRSVSPPTAPGSEGLYLQAIIDRPGGGFAAMTQYGLVRFE
jgi:hypothetical protein